MVGGAWQGTRLTIVRKNSTAIPRSRICQNSEVSTSSIRDNAGRWLSRTGIAIIEIELACYLRWREYARQNEGMIEDKSTPRSVLRFSIREVLWATTVLALSLGWWLQRQELNQTRAEVKELRAVCSFLETNYLTTPLDREIYKYVKELAADSR
jgi:hypothetical protein